jgi:hypothetical protein
MIQTMLTAEIQSELTLDEFKKISGLPEDFFQALLELGAFDEFCDGSGYAAGSVVVVKKANRLRQTFELDPSALALIIHYLNEVRELESEVKRLRCSH